jgi:hypothetical protein
MSEKIFVDGLIAKKPDEKAPDWVKCKLSVKREELIAWLTNQEGDWLNLQVSEGRNGKYYAEVDTWKPKND